MYSGKIAVPPGGGGIVAQVVLFHASCNFIDKKINMIMNYTEKNIILKMILIIFFKNSDIQL
jgi:hypothetical protein